MFLGATRVLRRPTGQVVTVRRARLRVTRGPARGQQLELSSLAPLVIGSDPEADLVLTDDGENIAGVDQLPLDDVDLLYLSIDPGAHRRDVSVNVRVIRTCIEYRITNEKRRTHGDYYHERCNDHYFVVEPESGTVCDRRCA